MEKATSKKIGIAIGVIIAIAAIVVCAAPLKTVAYTVMVDYQDTETYYEDEPYEDTETYYETEPLEYHIVNHTEGYAIERLPVGVENPCPFASVTVLNTDTASGTFIVHFYLTVEGLTPIAEGRFNFTSKDYQDEKELYLEPGEMGTALKYWTDYIIDDDYNCRWGHEVTGSKTIEKQRTVTKYRQVEKQRTVTKQRPETRYKKVTLLDYFLRYR